MTQRTRVVAGILMLMGGMTMADTVSICPHPQHCTFTGQTLEIGTTAWTVVVSPQADSLSQLGASRIASLFEKHQLTKPQITTTPPSSNAIFVGTIANQPTGLLTALKAIEPLADSLQTQGYALGFAPDQKTVYVLGKDPLGALYGCTTLEQLIQGTGASAYFSCATIRDWPDFKYRVLGVLENLPYVGFEFMETDEKFHGFFREYINDYLIPNRINVLNMRLGGFTYHDNFTADYWWTTKTALYNRLKWAVSETRKHGIEVEYADNAAVGYDGNQECKNLGIFYYPYGVNAYFCFSREDLIRKEAAKMGQFLKETGILQIYLHLVDNCGSISMCGCSECNAKFPGARTNEATYGKAQANLTNIYYNELQKYVGSNLWMNVVPSFYQGGREAYQRSFHQNLNASYNIAICMREEPAASVANMRTWYGNGTRPFYFYHEPAENLDCHEIMHLQSRYCRNYYNGNEQDRFYTWTGHSMWLHKAMFAYYAWNVDAPGSEVGYGANVYRDVETLKNTNSPARKMLDAVAKNTFGPTWGPLAVQAHLTWLLPGTFGADIKWNTVMSWFPQAGGQQLKFMEIMRDEAKRMYSVVQPIFSRSDVPHQPHAFDLYDVYTTIMGTYLLSGPAVWEKTASTPAQYQQAYDDTKQSLNTYCKVFTTIPPTSSAGFRFSNWDTRNKLELLLQHFASQAGVNAYFYRSYDFVRLKAGDTLNYSLKYKSHIQGSLSFEYTQKPNWVQATSAKISGIVPKDVSGTDTVQVILSVSGTAYDTLTLEIQVRSGTAVRAYPQIQVLPKFGLALANPHSLWGPDFLVHLEKPGEFSLEVYDFLGRRIWASVRRTGAAGTYQVPGDWSRLASGARLVVLRQNNRRAVARFVQTR